MVEPYSDKGRLKIVKREVKKHIEWLKLETGEWETHSMGVPVRDMNLLLDTIDADRKRIEELGAEKMTYKLTITNFRNLVSMKQNRIAELEEALEKIEKLKFGSAGFEYKAHEIARAARGEKGEKK